MEKKKFFPTIVKNTGSRDTLITDQVSSTEQRLFMLLPTLISTIVLTETFFDIRNSFKVKSSLAKVNFLLKTNTLDVSTTEKVTNIIHKLNFNQN